MMSRNFICKLPLNASENCNVWLEELKDRTLIDWWEENIQPNIRKDTNRPDYDWNWRKQYDYFRILSLRKQPCFFALCTKGKEGTVVLALCHCLTKEQYPPDTSLRSLFVWYLTSAPKPILCNHIEQSQIPGLIGRGSLDAALVESVAQGHSGRVWLHVAPEGGENLVNVYIKWGMHLIPKNTSVRRFGYEVNDKRYFYYDENTSIKSIRKFDQYRES